jgi:hypothetical protein
LRGGHYDDCKYFDLEGLLLAPGGLRHGDNVFDLRHFQKQIRNEKFIFMDDSFFKGRTRDAIEKALHHYGGQLIHTYVVYDGSEEPDPKVTSLYRYYDEIGG